MPTTAVLERKRVPAPAPPKPAVSPTASAPEQPGAAARALARSLPGGQDAVKSQPVAPGEEIELAGGSKLALTPEADEWLAAHKGPAGVRVRLGSLTHGTLQVRRTSSGLNTTDEPQVLPWPHPALVGLRRAVGLEPVLAVQVRSGLVKGHLSMWDGKHLLGPGAWVSKLEKAADALGWVGLERPQLDIGTNELQGPMLVVRTKTLKFWVSGGFLSGSGTFALEGESVTFEATLIGKVPGLTPITLPVKRAPDGSLTGSFTAGISLRNFSGQLTAAFGHGLVDIHGTANYNTERMSGSVTIVATDQQTAKALTDSQLPEEVQSAGHALVEPLPAVPNGAAPAAAPDGAAQAAGPRPGRRVVVGWGTLQVRLADWLGGDALVVMEHDGNVTVVGKVTPKMDHPLVEQQPEKTLHLFSFSAGAYYGIPVVGDVHLKASVDLEAFARFGPVTLDKMELDGNWSTNPERLKSLALTGTLNASAVAGLRLTAEGKVGLEILEHSIAIGAGMKATAGIKGYVVAVPRIGYREIADPQAGKRGEFFIGGHMEIAAQPFLGLEGYFFVDLDSPWWSPAPSKRWPWPIGSLEYGLPGMFGIGADVEHVLGSGKVPEVKFGQVSFDPDKFLTDLVDDKVPNKVARDDRKAGSWQEFPQPSDAAKTAEVPGAGKSSGPAPGAPPRVARATSAAPPRKDAATPPALPRGAPRPSPAGDARKSGVAADGGKVVSPEVQKRWLAAMADLRELKVQARKNPLTAEELAAALSDLRARHRFTELTARRQGDHWHLHAAMNPNEYLDLDKEVPQDPQAAAEEPQVVQPKGGPGQTQKRRRYAEKKEEDRLRALAKDQDKAAAEELLERYWKKSDRSLLALERHGDATAKAVLDQRVLSNEANLKKIKESEDRPTHWATVEIMRNSVVVHTCQLRSGNPTPEEKALPYPQRKQVTHTERRAVNLPEIRPGDVVTITGQYNPCNPCVGAMRRAARERRITVHYVWMGGKRTFTPGAPASTS